MSQEEGESGGMPENHASDVVEHDSQQLNSDSSIDSNLVKDNGLHVGNTHSNYYHDELVQMVQNEYMMSQDEGLKILLESDEPEQQKVQESDSSAANDDSDQPDPQKVQERDSRAGNDDSDQPNAERDSRDGDDDSDRPDPQNVEDRHSGAGDDLRDLREEIESLKRELLEERQTRSAAEEALKHLRAAHLEADTKAQELAAQFDEGLICC